MGCANSKQLKFTSPADVYRPPATSISLFDITTIDEPWLLTKPPSDYSAKDKPSLDPLCLLDNIDSFDLPPKSWSEVSKVLEDLKPLLHQKTPPPELAGFRSVKDNTFVVRDRLERHNSATPKQTEPELPRWKRRDPLEGYPESPPPGNSDGIVMYTTTLRGVRRTFEDCEKMRKLVEGYGVEIDERDVSLHGEYLREVRGMVGEGLTVPRLFVAGRYVGGVEEVEELTETGKLAEIMRCVGRGNVGGKKGRRDCEGCGGARFVPCGECSGSCKVAAGDGKGAVRCGVCNENGLALCSMCN